MPVSDPNRSFAHGYTHRALPATGSICVAVAARIGGSIVQRATRKTGDPKFEGFVYVPA